MDNKALNDSLKDFPGDQQVKRIIRKTLIPNFTAELSLSATSIVDGIIVGNFYGKQGLAAVGLGGPILSVFTIMAGLLGTGNSVLCTRSLGESSKETSNKTFSLSILLALVISVIMTTLTISFSGTIAQLFSGTTHKSLLPDVSAYIRGFSVGAGFIIFRQLLIPIVNIEGGNRHIHVSSVLILGSDALMDYIFSAWLDLGCFGLGLASALSYVVGCLPLIFFLITNKTGLSVNFLNCLSAKRTYEIMKAGFPTAVKRICNVITPVLTDRFILEISSVEAMAALSVQVSSVRFPLCLVLALSTTFLLISGSFYGEGDRAQLESGMKELLIQSLLWSTAISVVFFIFARPIAMFFIKDEQEVVGMAAYAIRWYIVGVPFMALNQCAASYLQSTKKLKASNAVIIADRLISTIILVYLLGWLWGEKGIFMSYGLSEILLTVVLYLLICIKNRGPVTKISQLLLLPNDYGVSDSNYLSVCFNTVDEATGFSEDVQGFCQRNNVDRKKSLWTALCVEELAVNSVIHGFTRNDQSVFIRIFIGNDNEIYIRLRDDGKPFNLDECENLSQVQEDDPSANLGVRIVLGLAKETGYHVSYGMNNTMIVL
jgi:Na+-driven multidrug efflux pump/anti-sigma regulatory factor (Ser/Thr protein kinase)